MEKREKNPTKGVEGSVLYGNLPMGQLGVILEEPEIHNLVNTKRIGICLNHDVWYYQDDLEVKNFLDKLIQ